MTGEQALEQIVVERLVSYGVLGILFLLALAGVYVGWKTFVGNRDKPGVLVRIMERHIELVSKLEDILSELPPSIVSLREGLDRTAKWQSETETVMENFVVALGLQLRAKVKLLRAQSLNQQATLKLLIAGGMEIPPAMIREIEKATEELMEGVELVHRAQALLVRKTRRVDPRTISLPGDSDIHSEY